MLRKLLPHLSVTATSSRDLSTSGREPSIPWGGLWFPASFGHPRDNAVVQQPTPSEPPRWRPLLQKLFPTLPWSAPTPASPPERPQLLAPHWLVAGAPGSGKTQIIQRLLAAAAAQQRFLGFDPKRDMVPFLAAAGREMKDICILNPMDARSVAIDWPALVRDDIAARQLATQLVPVPDRAGDNEFFYRGAQSLVYGVLASFRELLTKDEVLPTWSLRDVVLACSSLKRLLRVLGRSPEGRDVAQQVIFKDKDAPVRETASILATLHTAIMNLRPIAALMDHAESTVDLSTWATDPANTTALVLGWDPRASAVLEPLNRFLLEQVAAQLLTKPEYPQDETWIVIDEAARFGKHQSLLHLMAEGRSKGTHCVIGFQDIAGLRAVWGDKEADALVALCLNKAILRQGPSGAQWAKQVFGEYERIFVTRNWGTSTSFSKSIGSGGSTSTSESLNFSEQLLRTDKFLDAFFLELPPTSAQGIPGAFQVPGVALPWQGFAEPFWQTQKGRGGGSCKAFVERDKEQQMLRDWSPAEEAAFCQGVGMPRDKPPEEPPPLPPPTRPFQ